MRRPRWIASTPVLRITLLLRMTLLAAACTFALTGTASAAGCNDYWTGGGGAGDNFWDVAANWSGGVPTTATNVCLTNAEDSGSYNVDIDSYNPALVANSITVGGSAPNVVTLAILGTGGGVDVGNTLTLSDQDAGGGVLSTGAITLGSLSAGQPGAIVVSSGTLINDGTITAQPVAAGAAVDNAAFDTINGSFDNAGTLVDDWNFSSTLDTWTSSGTIDIGSGDRFDLYGPSDSSSFTQAGGTIANQGSFQQTDGTFVGTGGTSSGNPLELTSDNSGITVSPSGTGTDFLHIQTGGATLGSSIGTGYTVWASGLPGYSHGNLTTASGSLVNYGTLELGSIDGTHGTLTVPTGTFTNDGTLVFMNTANGPDGLDGALVNNGTVSVPDSSVQGSGVITNNGTFSLPAGSTFDATSFAQSAGGTLALAVGGGGSPSVPELQLAGAASLGGTLAVSTAGGTATGTFSVLSDATLTGTFGATRFSGENYSVAYASSGVSLTGPVAGATTGKPALQVGSIVGVRGALTVKLSCSSGSGSCANASIVATVIERIKGSRIVGVTARSRLKKNRSRTKTVVIARGSSTLTAGSSKTLTVRLNAAGKALLAKRAALKTVVAVSANGKKVRQHTITVRAAKAKKQKR